MEEIKSTLEVVMERTKSMAISEDEFPPHHNLPVPRKQDLRIESRYPIDTFSQ